jgi:hypothetical protein
LISSTEIAHENSNITLLIIRIEIVTLRPFEDLLRKFGFLQELDKRLDDQFGEEVDSYQ